jgi:hypothetical protein
LLTIIPWFESHLEESPSLDRVLMLFLVPQGRFQDIALKIGHDPLIMTTSPYIISFI